MTDFDRKEKEFISDYMTKLNTTVESKVEESVTEDKEKEDTRISVIIKNDTTDLRISALISSFIMSKIDNKTVINYDNDDLPDQIKKEQYKLNEFIKEDTGYPVESLEDVKLVTINVGDPNDKKMPIKALYRITDTKFDGIEFEEQPLEEIFGSIILIEEFLKDSLLFFFKDNKPHASWGYRYQENIIGGPGDYIVLYMDNELEILNGTDTLLENYRLPTLEELINVQETRDMV